MPGAYTVCAIPFPEEVRGMQGTMSYMEREGENLPAYCVAKEVTDAPEQPVTIEVKIPAFVPDASAGSGAPAPAPPPRGGT